MTMRRCSGVRLYQHLRDRPAQQVRRRTRTWSASILLRRLPAQGAPGSPFDLSRRRGRMHSPKIRVLLPPSRRRRDQNLSLVTPDDSSSTLRRDRQEREAVLVRKPVNKPSCAGFGGRLIDPRLPRHRGGHGRPLRTPISPRQRVVERSAGKRLRQASA